MIVRRRRDGDGLKARVDPRAHTGGKDGREQVWEMVADGLTGVKEGPLARKTLLVDRTRDNIARRKIAQGVMAGHERLTRSIDQARTVTA